MKDTAFVMQTLVNNIQLILPDLNASVLQPENSLKNLGADSIDRAEIIISTMASLNLTLPLATFAMAKNIGDLAALFAEHYAISSNKSK